MGPRRTCSIGATDSLRAFSDPVKSVDSQAAARRDPTNILPSHSEGLKRKAS
jgi:hypothetical protein